MYLAIIQAQKRTAAYHIEPSIDFKGFECSSYIWIFLQFIEYNNRFSGNKLLWWSYMPHTRDFSRELGMSFFVHNVCAYVKLSFQEA